MGEPGLLAREMKGANFVSVVKPHLEGVQQAFGEEPSQTNVFPENNNITTFIFE